MNHEIKKAILEKIKEYNKIFLFRHIRNDGDCVGATKGLKAIICSEKCKAEYLRKSYNELSVKGKVSRNKINLMTVYESKGLEFSSVCVVEDGLSSAERYIAYTRALKDLAVIKAKKQANE